MKRYIKPEIKISMFSVETVSTEENADARQSATYGAGITEFIESSPNRSVQRNYDFGEAIKFN